jgi:hypothetical protein
VSFLRAAPSATLANANQYTINTTKEGPSNIAPAADGNLIEKLLAFGIYFSVSLSYLPVDFCSLTRVEITGIT